jgi:hypothetical protein
VDPITLFDGILLRISVQFFYPLSTDFSTTLFTDLKPVIYGFIHGFKTCFLRIFFTDFLRIFFTGYLRHCFTDFGPVIHGFVFTYLKNPYVTGSLYARETAPVQEKKQPATATSATRGCDGVPLFRLWPAEDLPKLSLYAYISLLSSSPSHSVLAFSSWPWSFSRAFCRFTVTLDGLQAGGMPWKSCRKRSLTFSHDSCFQN